MGHCWQITCGKCGCRSGTDEWLGSDAVLNGCCHFQCPACGVKVRRKAVGVKRISIDGALCYVPDRIQVVELAD